MSPAAIPVDEAIALVSDSAGPLGSEPVALDHAFGRVLARDIEARESVPGFDNSAMDGVAVRSEDLKRASIDGPVTLTLLDESRAGSPAAKRVGDGGAVAISTGAPVPEGADAVVPLEEIVEGGSGREVTVVAAAEPGQHVRRAGEDVDLGELVLSKGEEVGSTQLGVLASVGEDPVEVAVRPRVRLLTTGDELAAAGDELPVGGVRDTNAYAIPSLVGTYGGTFEGHSRIGDDAGATEAAIAGSLAVDVVCICGGMSVGKHDHVRPALERLGVREVFWRVDMRPGRPIYFGVAPGGSLVFGLPGNPVSALVGFVLFVRRALDLMLGRLARPTFSARLDPAAREKGLISARGTNALRCQLFGRPDGLVLRPTGPQGSHILTSMRKADCLALVPGDWNGQDPVMAELLPGAVIRP